MNARLSDDIIIVIQLILHFVLTIGIDGHTEVSFKSKKKVSFCKSAVSYCCKLISVLFAVFFPFITQITFCHINRM